MSKLADDIALLLTKYEVDAKGFILEVVLMPDMTTTAGILLDEEDPIIYQADGYHITLRKR